MNHRIIKIQVSRWKTFAFLRSASFVSNQFNCRFSLLCIRFSLISPISRVTAVRTQINREIKTIKTDVVDCGDGDRDEDKCLNSKNIHRINSTLINSPQRDGATTEKIQNRKSQWDNDLTRWLMTSKLSKNTSVLQRVDVNRWQRLKRSMPWFSVERWLILLSQYFDGRQLQFIYWYLPSSHPNRGKMTDCTLVALALRLKIRCQLEPFKWVQRACVRLQTALKQQIAFCLC